MKRFITIKNVDIKEKNMDLKSAAYVYNLQNQKKENKLKWSNKLKWIDREEKYITEN